jgi:peptidoglycan/LPS O-acetylase OafA/YrhL
LAPLVADGVGVSASLSYWLFFIFPPYRFGEFLLGMLLARAARLGLRVPAPRVTLLVAAAGLGVVLWRFTAYTMRTGTAIPRPYVALLVLPWFALALLAGAGVGCPRTLVRLGEWSFALYLVHKPVFLVTNSWHWWHPAGLLGVALFLGYLSLALLAAAGLYHLVEKPVEAWLRTRGLGALRRRERRIAVPDEEPAPALAGRG